MTGPSLRRADVGDRARVLAWNQAPEVRAVSLDPRPIEADAHARWFAARLSDPATELWIAECDATPVGVVRVERPAAADDGRISIVLDPAHRGRGLGRAVIGLACAATAGPVIAEIRPDNHASQAAFVAAGFARWPARDRAGVLAFRWSRS